MQTFRQTTYLIVILALTSCHDKDNIAQTTPPPTNLVEERVRYDFTSEIKKWADKDKSGHGNQTASFLFSNIGQYFLALATFDQGEGINNQSVLYDSTNYNFFPAIEYITKEANKHQIIIINEAHHVPYHRFFTMLLLNKLKEQGFTYFGAETLNLWDSTLNKTNYPTFNTGYFTVEPQYGNLIRQALKSGFKVFAYEPNEQGDGMQREIGQARNIQKILKKDPKAKIIIHCGYAHLFEDNVEGWGKAMAGRLFEYTGIDPLTIDQVELTEHSDKKYENPYYDKLHFNDFTVPINNGKMMPISFRLDGHFSDIFVYHPRTHLMHNRPHWLFYYYTPKFINNEITISFPVLVKAYISTENQNEAIPIDIIEISDKADTTALALIPQTSYKIVIENKQKQKQTLNIDLK